jgi:hypothetical protein
MLFGNYLNREDNIWLCKLKNRGMEKNEELNHLANMSYSIIGEEILELSANENDCELVKCLRNLYLNLKLQAMEYKENIKAKIDLTYKTPWNYISFDFYGSRREYKQFIKIINAIQYEIEDALSKYINHQIKLNIAPGKIKNNKATTKLLIKEAN